MFKPAGRLGQLMRPLLPSLLAEQVPLATAESAQALKELAEGKVDICLLYTSRCV